MKKKKDVNKEEETIIDRFLRRFEELVTRVEKAVEKKSTSLPRFVDQKTVARKIGKTVRTVYTLRDKHKLPWKKVNGTVYILAEPLEKLFGITFEEE